MKTKYFCSAVVLEGFEIWLQVATIFYSLKMYGVSNRGTSNLGPFEISVVGGAFIYHL